MGDARVDNGSSRKVVEWAETADKVLAEISTRDVHCAAGPP